MPGNSVIGSAIRRGLWLLPFLVACAPQPSPEVLWPSAEPRHQTVQQPRAPDAMAELLSQADDYKQQQDWQAVIHIAEQGLRINRREPQWYLLLAESYLFLSQPEQAQHFAQLGKRYCSSKRSVCTQLRRLDRRLSVTGADKR